MALVKFGNGVAAFSGKIDGTVFSRNAYGAIARGWKKPVYPATTRQLAVNAQFGSQSQVWRTLTAAQQTAWNSLAGTVTFVNRIGASIFLTGQAMFNKLNQNLLSAGAAAITVAPAYTIPTAPLTATLAAAFTGNTMTLAYTPTPVPAGVVFQIWVTPQLSPGKTSVKKNYKLLTNVAAATASPANIRAAYVTMMGALIAGTQVFAKVRSVNITTGVASAFIQSSAIVGA